MKIQLNKIYNQDCVDFMSKIPDNAIDIVITSPPYNIIRPNSTDRGYDVYKDGLSNKEYSAWCCNIFNEFNRIVKKNGCILWNMSYGSENVECMPLTISEIIKNTNFTLADIIVWKKKTATPNNVSSNKLTRIVEFVYVFCRKDEFYTFFTNKKKVNERETKQPIYENLYNFIEAPNNDGSTELNKATFSSLLVKKLLQIYGRKNSICFDCFMGTGTTAIGCIDENINFVGCEISEKQCEYANKRIKQRLCAPSFFDEIDYEKIVFIE